VTAVTASPAVLSPERFARGSDNPDVTFFQLLYQSNEICDAGNGNVFECACRYFGYDVS